MHIYKNGGQLKLEKTRAALWTVARIKRFKSEMRVLATATVKSSKKK